MSHRIPAKKDWPEDLRAEIRSRRGLRWYIDRMRVLQPPFTLYLLEKWESGERGFCRKVLDEIHRTGFDSFEERIKTVPWDRLYDDGGGRRRKRAADGASQAAG